MAKKGKVPFYQQVTIILLFSLGMGLVVNRIRLTLLPLVPELGSIPKGLGYRDVKVLINGWTDWIMGRRPRGKGCPELSPNTNLPQRPPARNVLTRANLWLQGLAY